MRNYFLTILFSLSTFISLAQSDQSNDLFAFRITDNIVKQNGNTVIVHIQLNEGGIGIVEGQEGILKPSNQSGVIDTSDLGRGVCSLVNGSTYAFTITLNNGKRLPQKGDLIYTNGSYPTNYKGLVYNLLLNDIYLVHVTGERFYSFAFCVFGDQAQESSLIDSLVADIKYTGKEMLKKNPDMDRTIQVGPYKYKKLFTAMQEVTAKEVTAFIDYVIMRPLRYAGNNWKISEIFATWMDAGAPNASK